MPRKKQYQWDVETNGQEAPEQLSRSAKKRQSTALQDLGAELTKLPVNELDRLPLTPDLLEALRLYARISNREGKRRQLQFIGRLMREVDAGPLALTMVVDRSSLEIYLNGGAAVLSTRFYPGDGPVPLAVEGLTATVQPLRPMTFTGL